MANTIRIKEDTGSCSITAATSRRSGSPTMFDRLDSSLRQLSVRVRLLVSLITLDLSVSLHPDGYTALCLAMVPPLAHRLKEAAGTAMPLRLEILLVDMGPHKDLRLEAGGELYTVESETTP